MTAIEPKAASLYLEKQTFNAQAQRRSAPRLQRAI